MLTLEIEDMFGELYETIPEDRVDDDTAVWASEAEFHVAKLRDELERYIEYFENTLEDPASRGFPFSK